MPPYSCGATDFQHGTTRSTEKVYDRHTHDDGLDPVKAEKEQRLMNVLDLSGMRKKAEFAIFNIR